jgi:hypothetical protein
LWAEEPSFSNAEGSVHFEGVALSPGFNGPSGKVITVFFKAKALGSASLNFSSASVLANDGKGTNILTGTGKADYAIIKSQTPINIFPVKPKSAITSTSPTTILTSTTPVSVTESNIESATGTPFQIFISELSNLLSLIIPLIALVILLLLLILYIGEKFRSLKRRTSKESLEAEIALGKAFTKLKDGAKSRMLELESLKALRGLNPEESKFLEQLKSDLHSAEALIKKEIRDIERL